MQEQPQAPGSYRQYCAQRCVVSMSCGISALALSDSSCVIQAAASSSLSSGRSRSCTVPSRQQVRSRLVQESLGRDPAPAAALSASSAPMRRAAQGAPLQLEQRCLGVRLHGGHRGTRPPAPGQ